MRKGMFYTALVALLLTSVAFVLSLGFMSFKTNQNIEMKIRSDEIHYFLKDISLDAERALTISGKRALISVINYEISNGSFIRPVNTTIIKVMQTGEIDNEPQVFISGNTLPDWEAKIIRLANGEKIHCGLRFFNMSLKIVNYTKFDLKAYLNILLEDNIIKSELNRTVKIDVNISVDKLEDPFNTLNSYGFVITNYTLCPGISGKEYYGNDSKGIIYVDFSHSNLSTVVPLPDQKNYILLTDSIDNKTGYSEFSAIICNETPLTKPPLPYVFDVNYTKLLRILENKFGKKLNIYDLNGTIGIKYKNKFYVTMVKNNSNARYTCYFPWYGAPTFLDRLEGSTTPQPQYNPNFGIACLINTRDFPPELRKTIGFVLDYKYYPL